MEVDIFIDGLTDCLIERKTREKVETFFEVRNKPVEEREQVDWKFDWSITSEAGYKIYELHVKGSEVVQGRISLKIDGGVADVDIVETAPHNYGHAGKYIGVGGHLFAIACKISFDAGCDGVVAFNSKSDLVKYYKDELNAVEVYPRRMVIFEDAAKVLIDKYIKK